MGPILLLYQIWAWWQTPTLAEMAEEYVVFYSYCASTLLRVQALIKAYESRNENSKSVMTLS
jgi:hypothetical protein